MTLSILAYGDPILRKTGKTINKDYPKLKELIANMWETMYNANGVGLAAPQIGLPIRLFVVDTGPFADDEELTPEEQETLKNFKRVFINAKIEEESGTNWAFNEGCLSIPDIREDVSRLDTIEISYLDENFNSHKESYDGLLARVIQHEYDHIEGILFTDHLSAFKKRLLKSRLMSISKGKVQPGYRILAPLAK